MNLLEDINDWISLVHDTGNGAMPANSSRVFTMMLSHVLHMFVYANVYKCKKGSPTFSFLHLGYVIYRRVLCYCSGEEVGLDMRKALSRDVEKKSIIPLKRPVTPDELECD
ncbi:N-alpha-acetyltransferase 20 [Gossypium australe]|uniref:N-alpha-acetyltransferase 20 n=1 Tax=Gossypium australe TaxID=47621 RepID=A0A5B6W1M0_9ROSI|nr:N-alpha-acetyltransferase 20 [Gossypium australe]KAA3474987.1 N-alpha-acetyltransferase 20 [Gossypium australe]